jgi:ABC-type antimicrobial peptide transport system permease subunit
MEQLVSRSVGDRRFNFVVLGSFASMALILAGIGIYGRISSSTGQRSAEIRVQMALGATEGKILRLIIGEGLFLTLTGVTGIDATLPLLRRKVTLLRR